MEKFNYEEYKKAKLSWEQEPEGGSYGIVESGSERELRMLEAELELNLRRRPGFYEQYPGLKAESEASIKALRLKLYWTAPIRIFIFDNRIEVHSPGNLPNGLTVQDVVSGASLPRNNFLFNNAIHLLPYTGVGSGIRRALDDGAQLEFKDDKNLHEFIITIPRTTDPDTNSDSDHDTGNSDLDTFATDLDTKTRDSDTYLDTCSSDLDTFPDDLVTDKGPFNKKVTKKQQDVINFCSVPRSSKEILDRLGLTNHSKNREKHIMSLVKAGYLEMTIPESPNSRFQKYRKRTK